ncbi:MAG: transporter substrate-binding domain-containing protein [Phycisphaerales bacterium]|nr:transporter substrate-binding domain-containing protein [Phycisphaerales bacterium]
MIRAVLLTLTMCVSSAQGAEPLRIGLVESAPFATKDKSGVWTGVAVELWRLAATRLNVEWTPVEHDSHNQTIDALAEGQIDLAVGGFTVTPKRAERVDFLAAWESASTGVATPRVDGLQFTTMIGALADSAFLGLSLVMISMVLLFGIAIWLCERRHNHGEFGGGHHHGLGSGLWWSMVTMSTVGYGDKSPRTWSGRLVAGIWIMMGLVLVSVFTGAAATAFTQRAMSDTAHLSDLTGKRVAALDGGDTQSWLREQGVAVTGVESIQAGLQQLVDGKLDALVADAPVLRWGQLHKGISDIEIRSGLRPERLAFAMRPGLSQARELNVALLEAMQSVQWTSLMQKWGWPQEGVLR